MRAIIVIILMASAFLTVTAQNKTVTEQDIIQLSKDKWQWMADKDVVKLEPLFQRLQICTHEWHVGQSQRIGDHKDREYLV